MNKDLRSFLADVRKAGPEYYVEVNRPLKPYLEPCIIQEKLAKEGRFPVLSCPEIEGSKIPLVTNLFGCYETFAITLGMDPKNIDKAEILQEYRKRVNDLKPPKTVLAKDAPVKEVILKGEDADLGLLPLIHHQELNSGKYIPIGFMMCRDPETGVVNSGVYRHEVQGKNLLGAMINFANHGACIARRYAELGKNMEVALVIGHHPAVVHGAITRNALELDELEVMGGLLGEPIEVVKGETVDILVPAWAEIVIEGTIDPSRMVNDGPFSEWPGYYGPEYPAYQIKVNCITMRKDAIYHDFDAGHQEHGYSGLLPSASIVWDAIKRVIPELKAVHLPPSGNCRSHIYVSIKKRVQGEARLAAIAALGASWFSHLVVVVDDDIDVYDEQEVLWAVSTRVVGDQDICTIPRVTSTILNPTSYDETRLERGNMLTYVIIDATKPIDRPFLTRVTPNKDYWEFMKLEDYLK